MKHLATAAIALILGMGSASAAVHIGLATGGPITTVASGADVAGFAGAFGGFFSSIAAADPPDGLSASTALEIAGGPGSLQIYVTTTDHAAEPGFVSGLTANLLPAGWTATISTFLGATNGIYEMTTLLGSATFTNIGTDVDISWTGAPGPFSTTTLYDISSSGIGTSLLTARVAAVPEPASLFLLGAGLVGLGVMRRARKA